MIFIPTKPIGVNSSIQNNQKMNRRIFTLILLAFVSGKLCSQTPLTGQVIDGITREPLLGATVMVKGSTQGTTTSNEGSFSFPYQGDFPSILVISYLGYATEEVAIHSIQHVVVSLVPNAESLQTVTVTARRRNEEVQEIPISISVIAAKELDNSTSFNVNRVKELLPSVQLYSSNPRNTTLNIRGIGSTFGLTNDGIDPGVGFYVDGVYFARPAAATLDFIDIQQIEVLRGPQGTLFGKNTTAGTFNITSRKPTLSTAGIFEQSFGNYGFIQTRASISGPLVKHKLAARLSFTGTQRSGTTYNVAKDVYTNTLNNQGIRAQLLYLPSEKVNMTVSADYSRQRPDGYAHVVADVAVTQRADFRQFEQIISSLGYDLPSRNPFDRIVDHDTPARSDQDMGGVSLNMDFEIGNGTLTSTSAWRTWEWGPSSDRDFTGLSAITKSQAPSVHEQWTQEIRYSGIINRILSGTVGLFGFYQKLDPIGSHLQEAGKDQWRFVQNNQDPLWQTPGLLDGLQQLTKPRFRNFSGALFSQIDWKITKNLIATPGLRLNYDQKEVDFARTITGGLRTDDPDLIALKERVFSSIAFKADVDDWDVSGQLGLRYTFRSGAMTYGTFAYGFKPVGLNLGGIPKENGKPALHLAVIKPERVRQFELGIKTQPTSTSTVNFTVFNTDIFDYQTTVRSADIGVIRGYLANADQVRTSGAELEVSYHLPKSFRFTGSLSYTDGKYVKFKNAPVPLEETGSGGNELKDVSGGVLPGISKWSFTTGVEASTEGNLIGQEGEYFIGMDIFYRSSFSSNPTPSEYLYIDGYSLINARIGFRPQKGIAVYVWSRNLTETNYFEQLLAAGGNAGHIAGVLGDPRTFGVTLRYNLY